MQTFGSRQIICVEGAYPRVFAEEDFRIEKGM